MTSKPPPPASPAELSRLSRDGLLNKIRSLEKELYRVHAVASTNGITIPPYKSRSPSPSLPAPSSHELAKHNGPPLATATETSEPENKSKGPKKKKKPQPFNSRLVALKLAYLGKNYGGFEFQASANAQSVEEVIWRALVKSCLIIPEDPDRIDWLPFQYAKCGRTDKGVSAFGQVISIRLRSSKPMPKPEPEPVITTEDTTHKEAQEGTEDSAKKGKTNAKAPDREWDHIKDEIDYIRTINRLLPADVRIIAWCPTVPEDFDARFSCGERRYRYFFTQPAFAPLPGVLETEELTLENPKKHRKRARSPSPPLEPIMRYKEGWLDIEAMREAAKYFPGSHDFRNFCRIDGGKQISEFTRMLFDVTIEEVKDIGTIVPYVTDEAFRPRGTTLGDEPHPKVYSFNVYGNAFLWHQIRCMIGVLFLVGQGLEKPTIVKDLLDVKKNPRKPQYIMADEVPLVLWDCLFPKDREGRGDSLDWVYNSDHDLSADHGAHGMYDHLWSVWRERKMDEILANRLLDLYTRKGNVERRLTGQDDPDIQKGKKHLAKTYRLYEGGNNARTDGRFIPMRKKELQPSFQEINDAFARRKGFKSSEDMKAGGNWLAEVRARKAAELAAEVEAVGKAAAIAAGLGVERPIKEEPVLKTEPELMIVDDDVPAMAADGS